MGFNRTILECKAFHFISPENGGADLIEPYWNVKFVDYNQPPDNTLDLIEPYWNVKRVSVLAGRYLVRDLIEPYWNVKIVPPPATPVVPRFNRTILECKVSGERGISAWGLLI